MSVRQTSLLVAVVEHVFAKYRGKLPWAHDVVKAWAVQHVPRHITPMSRAHAELYAVHLCGPSAEKLAAGLLLQRGLGLRPSESFGLVGSGVALPERHLCAIASRAVFAPGFRQCTRGSVPKQSCSLIPCSSAPSGGSSPRRVLESP